jgi:arylsulfatase A-like enzyme
MLVHYPRQVKAGQKIERIVSNVDLVPTVLDFCGISIPKQVQGVSWKPLITSNPTAAWREAFVYTMPGRQHRAPVALRTEHDKLILARLRLKPTNA